MECPGCRRSFTPQDAEKMCRSCGSYGGCRLLKCPHCGYESPAPPPVPGVIRWFRDLFRGGEGARERTH